MTRRPASVPEIEAAYAEESTRGRAHVEKCAARARIALGLPLDPDAEPIPVVPIAPTERAPIYDAVVRDLGRVA